MLGVHGVVWVGVWGGRSGSLGVVMFWVLG